MVGLVSLFEEVGRAGIFCWIMAVPMRPVGFVPPWHGEQVRGRIISCSWLLPSVLFWPGRHCFSGWVRGRKSCSWRFSPLLIGHMMFYSCLNFACAKNLCPFWCCGFGWIIVWESWQLSWFWFDNIILAVCLWCCDFSESSDFLALHYLESFWLCSLLWFVISSSIFFVACIYGPSRLLFLPIPWRPTNDKLQVSCCWHYLDFSSAYDKDELISWHS